MSKLSRRQLARYGADQLLAGVSPKKIAQELAAVLVSSRRSNEAELLVDDIAWELEARGQVANATVTTARQLTPALLQQLLKSIKQASSVAAVNITEQVDPSILGGLRVETAQHSWDETIARRLNDLKGAV